MLSLYDRILLKRIARPQLTLAQAKAEIAAEQIELAALLPPPVVKQEVIINIEAREEVRDAENKIVHAARPARRIVGTIEGDKIRQKDGTLVDHPYLVP